MSRPLDLSALTRAERAALATGTAGFLNGLLPWWFRTTGPAGTFLYGASLEPLTLLATLTSALAAMVALIRAWIWPNPAPRRDGLVYLTLGSLSAVSIAVQFAVGNSAWIGMGLGMLLSLGLAFSGLRRRRERSAGWS